MRRAPSAATKAGYYRWYVCALLFFASVINYIDRQVIGILKPTLQQQFGWSELDYGDIVFSFQLAYAIGFLFAGRLMDRLGTRVGFSIAILIWSLAAMAHAAVMWIGPATAAILGMAGLAYTTSVAGFMAARFALGLGEAGNFPGAVKTVAEWFPRKERAFATGIFNAGTNIGALLTPLIVPVITLAYGWEWAFIITGALGFIWLAFWWVLYRSPEEQHARDQGRAVIYQKRSAGADHENVVGDDPSASADMDLRGREVHDRPDLVAVSLLDSRFSLPQSWPESHNDGTAYRRDLSDRRCGQRWRRVAVVYVDQARLVGECLP